MNLDDIDNYDLVLRLTDLARQTGALKTKATAPQQRESIRKAHWAQFREVETRFDETLAAVLQRLGATASVTNREAFLFLAAKKSRGCCSKCGAAGGWNGRYLHWYAADGTPAPLLQAHQGVPVEVIKTALPFSDLLCPRCAKLRGAKLTKVGTPRVSAYLTAA